MTCTFTVPKRFRVIIQFRSDGTMVVTIEPIGPTRSRSFWGGVAWPAIPFRLRV